MNKLVKVWVFFPDASENHLFHWWDIADCSIAKIWRNGPFHVLSVPPPPVDGAQFWKKKIHGFAYGWPYHKKSSWISNISSSIGINRTLKKSRHEQKIDWSNPTRVWMILHFFFQKSKAIHTLYRCKIQCRVWMILQFLSKIQNLP